jgi:hypothetical protein
MVTPVPWPELAKTAKRICRTGCEALWRATSPACGSLVIPVRCYPSPGFSFITVTARQRDLPRLLTCDGEVRITASGGETLLLSFHPDAAMVLPAAANDTLSSHRWCDVAQDTDDADSEPVLIIGHVDAVEFQVPSHAIDVIAALRPAAQGAPARALFGLN